MYGPGTIKTFKPVDLSEGKSLVSKLRFRSETLRVIVKALTPAEVEHTAAKLTVLFTQQNLRTKGPIPHKRYRGRLTLRDPKTGSEGEVLHGCLIHSRELRVYDITQEAINSLIQFQCPLTVQIEVRKGLANA